MPSASDSDEAVASEIESTAIAQLDDATSFVHIHPAFLTLMAKAELEKIPDVETVCIQFIAAFKEVKYYFSIKLYNYFILVSARLDSRTRKE